MEDNLFKNGTNYWEIVDTIKHLYMSDGSMVTLMDFDRVLDELDIYSFRNWTLGELISGPEVARYSVSCTFLWPYKLMPDPRAAKRLLPFGCTVTFKQSTMQAPLVIKSADDFRPGTKKSKFVTMKIWLVAITVPKNLIADVRAGAAELEDQQLDLDDLNLAYDVDENNETINNDINSFNDELESQNAEGDDIYEP